MIKSRSILRSDEEIGEDDVAEFAYGVDVSEDQIKYLKLTKQATAIARIDEEGFNTNYPSNGCEVENGFE